MMHRINLLLLTINESQYKSKNTIIFCINVLRESFVTYFVKKIIVQNKKNICINIYNLKQLLKVLIVNELSYKYYFFY